jgi:hypothetical protein
MDRVRKAYARELGAALDLDEDAISDRIDAAIAKRVKG